MRLLLTAGLHNDRASTRFIPAQKDLMEVAIFVINTFVASYTSCLFLDMRLLSLSSTPQTKLGIGILPLGKMGIGDYIHSFCLCYSVRV